MRKRRRLANKLMIMMCAVLIAVSTFFYAPMDVRAEEVTAFTGSNSNSYSSSSGRYLSTTYNELGNVVLADSLSGISPDLYYEVEIASDVNITSSQAVNMRVSYLTLGRKYVLAEIPHTDSMKNYSNTFSRTFVMSGSDLLTSQLVLFNGYIFRTSSLNTTYKVSANIKINSCTPISSSFGDEYESGYNAGFSDGESSGYGNGYSDGFLDGEESGFQAGQDSVDTDSYYNAGYQVGYQAAFAEGYNTGYAEGLKSAQGSSGEWGLQKKLIGDGETIYGLPFYVSSYGLVDRELYQGTDSLYFYNTVPGTFKGVSEIRYKMPLSQMNGFGACVSDSGCTNVSFLLPNVKLNESIDLGGAQTSGHIISKHLNEVFVTYGGKKYYGVIGSDYVNFDFMINEPVDELLFSDSNFQITFVVEHSLVVVTDADITHYLGAKYTPYVSFDSFNFFVKPYYKNDRVSANIQDQTDKLVENSDKNTDKILNGWDSSHGNSVNDNLSSGLNEYQTAEDSLWATATTGLKDFTFFDFESVPAMITGLSFVTSIMTTWFNNAGGASGVGIVLSVLFSVMLVSMVLGLYRMYQSAGHRAEVQKKRESRKKGK